MKAQQRLEQQRSSRGMTKSSAGSLPPAVVTRHSSRRSGITDAMGKMDLETTTKGAINQDGIIDETSLKLSKRWLFAFFAITSIIPTVVLALRGYMDNERCIEELSVCIDDCTRTYADDTRVFQSEFERERQCKDDCRSQDATCTDRAQGVLIAALLLAVGLVCAVSMFYAFEGIVQKFMEARPLDSLHPRAVYHEPTETEEEKWHRAAGRWGYLLAERRLPVTEAFCSDCGIGVEVDFKWLTCERGGMDGAVCPRCRRVILGVL